MTISTASKCQTSLMKLPFSPVLSPQRIRIISQVPPAQVTRLVHQLLSPRFKNNKKRGGYCSRLRVREEGGNGERMERRERGHKG